MWEVEYTHDFEHWWESLTIEQQEAIDDRVMLLAEHGPALKQPVVGDIKSSRHPNMKELRASKGGVLRVLFAFRSSPACDSSAWRRQIGRVGELVQDRGPGSR